MCPFLLFALINVCELWFIELSVYNIPAQIINLFATGSFLIIIVIMKMKLL